MNKRFINSVQGQLFLRLIPPLSLILAVGVIAAFMYARHIGSTVYDRWLYDSAMTLGQQVQFNGGKVALELPPSAIQMFEWDSVDRIFEQVISSRSGSVFTTAEFPLPGGKLIRNTPRFYDGVINGMPTRIVALLIADPLDPANTALIQVAETKHKRESLAIDILGLIIPLSALALVLAGAAVWYAVNSSLQRVHNISARLSQYDATALVPFDNAEQSPVEVKPLLDAINQLIAKLAEAHELQRRFIANAAHQLRTPLATLHLQAERALREPDPQQHKEALSDVLNAVARSQHLVQQLMTLARSEQSVQQTLAMQNIDLAELVRSELEEWIDNALSRRIDLGYEGPESGVVVQADAQLLRQLLGNLIDNALQYGDAGGQVTVKLNRDSPVTLVIDDNGAGIPNAERTRVLERFYRSPGAKGNGCGLGLAIANEIAAAHCARLRILDNPQGTGTRIEIVFPTGLSRQSAA